MSDTFNDDPNNDTPEQRDARLVAHVSRAGLPDRYSSPHNLRTNFQRPDTLHTPADTLYVVTTLFNARRFRSRWKLYESFVKLVAESGAKLITVEIAFGDRAFYTKPGPWTIQLRTYHEIWFKEAAINLGVRHLPLDWKYVAWIDADCLFARQDWADECKHMLQHFPIVQMWSQLHDLNSDHELVGTIRSFGDVWVKGDCPRYPVHRYGYPPGKPGYPGAPGLAWAMRREAWEQMGGMIDFCVLGAADSYMAYAFTGQMHKVVHNGMHPRLREKLMEYQSRALNSWWQERPIAGNLGVMKGVCLHYWHGPKVYRRYGTREQILYGNKYNPDVDLKLDWQGLPQLTNRNPQLRRDIQAYFSQRNEDMVSEEG